MYSHWDLISVQENGVIILKSSVCSVCVCVVCVCSVCVCSVCVCVCSVCVCVCSVCVVCVCVVCQRPVAVLLFTSARNFTNVAVVFNSDLGKQLNIS